jgi:hypothetical protein
VIEQVNAVGKAPEELLEDDELDELLEEELLELDEDLPELELDEELLELDDELLELDEPVSVGLSLPPPHANSMVAQTKTPPSFTVW